MSLLLALVSIALALTLAPEGVTSWGVQQAGAGGALEQQQQPLILQLTANAQADQGYDDIGQRQIIVQDLGSPEWSGERSGEGEGQTSDLQLVVPIIVVDQVGDSQEQRDDAPGPLLSWNFSPSGQKGPEMASGSWFGEQRAEGPQGTTLARLLMGLLNNRGPPTPLNAPRETPVLAHRHDRAQSSNVCPACLMLKALKMMQLQSGLQPVAVREGESDTGAGGVGGDRCAMCVMELQRARRLAARAGPGEGEGEGGQTNVHIVS